MSTAIHTPARQCRSTLSFIPISETKQKHAEYDYNTFIITADVLDETELAIFAARATEGTVLTYTKNFCF